MANFGEVLRSTYADLTKDYCNGCVEAHTLNYDPAEESLNLVLKNIYSDATVTITKAELLVDDLLLVRRCPKFNALLNDTYSKQEVKAKIEDMNDLFKHLSDYSGFLDADLKIAVLLANIMEVEEANDLILPTWYTSDTKIKLKAALKLFYKIYTYQPEMKKIAIGPLLGVLLKEIRTTAMVQKRLFLYSVNQEQIESFLQGLGLGVNKETSFGSAIILEKLRKADNKIEIRFKYYKGDGEEFETLTLNECTEKCPLDTLLTIVKPIIEVPEIKEGDDPSKVDIVGPLSTLCRLGHSVLDNDLNANENNTCED